MISSTLRFLIFSLGGASTLLLLWLALTAMMGSGSVLVDFNEYHEGWPEVALFATTAASYPWAMWQTFGRNDGRS